MPASAPPSAYCTEHVTHLTVSNHQAARIRTTARHAQSPYTCCVPQQARADHLVQIHQAHMLYQDHTPISFAPAASTADTPRTLLL